MSLKSTTIKSRRYFDNCTVYIEIFRVRLTTKNLEKKSWVT